MAILTTFEIHGDTEELFATHRDKIAPIAQPVAEENGGISSTILKTEDGVMIVNMWESEAGMEKVAEVVGPQAREAGLSRPVNWKKYEVLSHMVD